LGPPDFLDVAEPTTSSTNFNYASKKSIASRRSRASHVSQPHFVKDTRSVALSVFNMMNLIVGGGVIGLPFAASNFGYIGFCIAIGSVVCIAMITQYFNLTAAEELNRIDPIIIPGYEELGYYAAGQRRWGKWVVSSIVMFHTFTCCCAYSFVIKKEIGPILARMMNLFREKNETIDLAQLRGGHLDDEFWYLNETFLVGCFIAVIILPLSCLRNVKYLGWTSMIAIVSVLFFVGTVISQASTASDQCGHLNFPPDCDHCPAGTQTCSTKAFEMTSQTIFSLPTLLFSFECHGTMLPIYCDLRRRSKTKMLKIIATSLTLVVTLYTLTALYGYKSFYNFTNSEFLLMFEYVVFDTTTIQIIILLAKLMMVLVVTFSAPLFCFVLRKSVFQNIWPDEDPEYVDGKYHYGFTIATMAIVYCIVASVQDLKIFFTMGGQISATNLMIVFPSCFYVFFVHKNKKFQLKTIVPWILIAFGIFNQTVGTVVIVWHEITADAHAPANVSIAEH
jgi:amino acid permease